MKLTHYDILLKVLADHKYTWVPKHDLIHIRETDYGYLGDRTERDLRELAEQRRIEKCYGKDIGKEGKQAKCVYYRAKQLPQVNKVSMFEPKYKPSPQQVLL